MLGARRQAEAAPRGGCAHGPGAWPPLRTPEHVTAPRSRSRAHGLVRLANWPFQDGGPQGAASHAANVAATSRGPTWPELAFDEEEDVAILTLCPSARCRVGPSVAPRDAEAVKRGPGPT